MQIFEEMSQNALENLYQVVAKKIAVYYRVHVHTVLFSTQYLFKLESCYEHVLKKIELYNPNLGDFEGWVYRVVVNKCRDIHRSRKGQCQTFGELHVVEGVVETQSESGDVDKEALLLQIYSGLERVSARNRELLEMFFLQEMNYNEIAEETGLSKSSLGKMLNRARQELRKALNKYPLAA